MVELEDVGSALVSPHSDDQETNTRHIKLFAGPPTSKTRKIPDNRIRTTKYTVLTFLPLNLFQQFSRIANFYFLVIVGLLYVPGLPIEAAVAAAPLALVIAISAIREGVEDVLRFRSDQRVNASVAHRFSKSPNGTGVFEDCIWESLEVGDCIKILKNEQIPADVVVLSSNDEDGILYTDTCNLDGETNLKVRHAVPQMLPMRDESELQALKATIDCDLPNNRLYTFNGCLNFHNDQYSIDNNEVLLRGCNLRNTEYAIGIIVYTGWQTKLMMNSSAARAKRSLLERTLNRKLIGLLIFLVVWAFIAGGIGFSWQRQEVETGRAWYMFYSPERYYSSVVRFFILTTSNLVIINAIIPISLYVTLELVRVFQALFVAWDKDMWDEETGTGAAARTSNISDDLGQIEYVFSDKTGTLTRNVMEFMKCSVGGRIFGRKTTDDSKAAQDEESIETLRTDPSDEIKHFLWLLSTSHAVIPEIDESRRHKINFQASSPDEAALVEAAADFGYVFTERTPDRIVVNVNDERTEIELLANLEFTSERKRSSVIIRRPDTGQIVLYCKGADDLIFARLADGPREQTLEHLKKFAAEGLRTLCCAYRILDEDFYRDWETRYNEAACTIDGRDEKVNEVANEVESELTLIGATAIEDKLQVGVPSTIVALMRAKIYVWVITGDKRETAINIAYSCGLLNSDSEVVLLDYNNLNDIQQHWPVVDEVPENVARRALVISGATLEYVLSDDWMDRFYELTKRCQAVVACRVSPLQKATIVRMIRTKANKLTLAIGDGANDVGMIMEADVGVGISGKEGRQAVLASDYSFGQFRFLQQLLFVHGRLNFYRNVELVNYSFYKNMVFSFGNILFQFFSNFSGNTVYNPTLYTVFNVLFTSAPPVIYAALERDVGKAAMIAYPDLYDWDGRRKEMVGIGKFIQALALGILHSVIAFFIPYGGMQPYIDQHGRAISLTTFGITVYAVVVLTVNIKIAAMCHYWTVLHYIFILGSIILYPIAVCVISVMGMDMSIYQTGYLAFTLPSFWLSFLLASFITVFPILLQEIFSNGRNRRVNQVVLHGKQFGQVQPELAAQQYVNENPVVEEHRSRTTYVDPTNQTGYIMDAPDEGARTTQTLRTRTVTRRNIPSTVAKPSTFVAPE